MQRIFLRAKIHRAKITETCLEYEGSITIDPVLLEAVGMLPYEQVHVYNVSNGRRFTTYIILGQRGTGQIVVNGAAARLVEVGHHLIIAAYGILDEKEVQAYKPTIVVVDERNQIRYTH